MTVYVVLEVKCSACDTGAEVLGVYATRAAALASVPGVHTSAFEAFDKSGHSCVARWYGHREAVHVSVHEVQT